MRPFKTPPKFDNHFARMIVRFQAQLEVDGCFSAQKSSYVQAFVISLATAFVHIIGALILVLVSVFVLQSVLNRFMEDSISYITALSAVIIMFLALYILYRKLNKKSYSCCSCNIDLKSTSFSTNSSTMNFVKTSANKPIIDTKARKKQDLLLEKLNRFSMIGSMLEMLQ